MAKQASAGETMEVEVRTDGYELENCAVVCPECQTGFATICLVDTPPVSEEDVIEADLHRVLPDPAIRGALVTVCPHCAFASWTVKFKRINLRPDILPDAKPLENCKKYALAVKCARQKGLNPLDIAFLAISGLYCARESGEDDSLWLELAAYEQSKGMSPEFLVPDNGQDHLTMAELWRQLKQFDKAIVEYNKARLDDWIPVELLEHQIFLSKAGDWTVTTIPPYMVRQVFPEAAEFGGKKKRRRVPNNPKLKHHVPKQYIMPNSPPGKRPPIWERKTRGQNGASVPQAQPTNQPIVVIRPVDEPMVAAKLADQPTVATTPVDQPITAAKPEQPITAAKPVEQPVIAAKPVEQPIIAAKPVEQPIIAAKPVEQPVIAAKPAEQPIIAAKPVEQPIEPVAAGSVVDPSSPKAVGPGAQSEPSPTFNVHTPAMSAPQGPLRITPEIVLTTATSDRLPAYREATSSPAQPQRDQMCGQETWTIDSIDQVVIPAPEPVYQPHQAESSPKPAIEPVARLLPVDPVRVAAQEEIDEPLKPTAPQSTPSPQLTVPPWAAPSTTLPASNAYEDAELPDWMATPAGSTPGTRDRQLAATSSGSSLNGLEVEVDEVVQQPLAEDDAGDADPNSGDFPQLQLTDDQLQPNYSDAVAQVESFLSLTRHPTYQSWIRGYRNQ